MPISTTPVTVVANDLLKYLSILYGKLNSASSGHKKKEHIVYKYFMQSLATAVTVNL